VKFLDINLKLLATSTNQMQTRNSKQTIISTHLRCIPKLCEFTCKFIFVVLYMYLSLCDTASKGGRNKCWTTSARPVPPITWYNRKAVETSNFVETATDKSSKLVQEIRGVKGKGKGHW